MAGIDIRVVDDEEIDVIRFADEDSDDIYDVASDIRYDADSHPQMLFLHYSDNEYIAVAKRDVKNLIKALEKSLEIWKD